MTDRLAAFSYVCGEYNNDSFHWGVHDCCTYLSCYLEKYGAVNPYKEFIGQYDSPNTAYRSLLSRGYDSVGGVLDKHFKRIRFSSADFGDIALLGHSSLEKGAICMGERVVRLMNGEHCKASFARAWRLPRCLT